MGVSVSSRGYPQSSIYRWIFPCKPSSYWGTPVLGNLHVVFSIYFKAKYCYPLATNISQYWPLVVAKVEGRRQTHAKGSGPHVRCISGLVLLAALVLSEGAKRGNVTGSDGPLGKVIPQMAKISGRVKYHGSKWVVIEWSCKKPHPFVVPFPHLLIFIVQF